VDCLFLVGQGLIRAAGTRVDVGLQIGIQITIMISVMLSVQRTSDIQTAGTVLIVEMVVDVRVRGGARISVEVAIRRYKVPRFRSGQVFAEIDNNLSLEALPVEPQRRCVHATTASAIRVRQHERVGEQIGLGARAQGSRCDVHVVRIHSQLFQI